MKIGFLGPKGTFSFEACQKYFNNSEEKLEYKTIVDTILALKNNEVDYAIVPIENSLQGCVTDAIDTLISNEEIKVVDELVLDINQNLMAKEILNFEEITVIYSHPQAIAQCREYLLENNLNDKVVSVESTALAAKKVKESNEKCACISNLACLEEYNLKLLDKSIQDNEFNKTKFWILSKNENLKNNNKKMSMIFSVKDKPGALYNVLKVFNEYNLNLTKIESRPAKTVMGEYIFWIDVMIGNTKEDEAIRKIEEEGIFVRILGKY